MEPLPAPWSRRRIVAEIERLDISADGKLVLAKLSETRIAIGSKVIAIGRQILSFVFEALRTFPMTTFGLLIGVVISLLIGSVALIGGLLAPLIGPLVIATGIGVGALADIQSHVLRQRVTMFEAQMRAATRG